MAKRTEKFKHFRKLEACYGLMSCPPLAPRSSTKKSSTHKDFNTLSKSNCKTTTWQLTSRWIWCCFLSLCNTCWLSVVSSSNLQETPYWSVSVVQAVNLWPDWLLKYVSTKSSKSKSQRHMESSNGRRIWRRFWNSQEEKISRQFSYSQTVKSRTRLLLKISTTYLTLMKFLTYSHLIKRQNLSKWSDRSWRQKVSLKKGHLHKCIVSSLKSVRRTCTLFWRSVQLETTSEQEWECSHHWSTAAQSIGSKTGHKTHCCGSHVSFWTPSRCKNRSEKNACKWCNITTPQHQNGLRNSCTN